MNSVSRVFSKGNFRILNRKFVEFSRELKVFRTDRETFGMSLGSVDDEVPWDCHVQEVSSKGCRRDSAAAAGFSMGGNN